MVGDESEQRARVAFVAMIKEENFYADFTKQSLRQHWNGAASGFHDHQVQSRWHDFLAGWKAMQGEAMQGEQK